MIKMENEVFEDMYRLMLYDDSQPNKENNNVVKAYLTSQIKALNHLQKLLDKHKPAFDELEKIRQAEKKKADKYKEQKSTSNENVKSEKNDEMNLFEENETECVK
jgi:hypothetical protein